MHGSKQMAGAGILRRTSLAIVGAIISLGIIVSGATMKLHLKEPIVQARQNNGELSGDHGKHEHDENAYFQYMLEFRTQPYRIFNENYRSVMGDIAIAAGMSMLIISAAGLYIVSRR